MTKEIDIIDDTYSPYIVASNGDDAGMGCSVWLKRSDEHYELIDVGIPEDMAKEIAEILYNRKPSYYK